VNIKKYIKKISKASTFGILITGFIIGLATMYLYIQPKLSYQGKSVVDWVDVAKKNENLANQNQIEAISYKEQLASTSAQLASASAQVKTLLARPPQVKYITQTEYVQQPIQDQPVQPQSTSSNCEPDYDGMGGQRCTTNTGVVTHCDPNYDGMGGMRCN